MNIGFHWHAWVFSTTTRCFHFNFPICDHVEARFCVISFYMSAFWVSVYIHIGRLIGLPLYIGAGVLFPGFPLAKSTFYKEFPTQLQKKPGSNPGSPTSFHSTTKFKGSKTPAKLQFVHARKKRHPQEKIHTFLFTSEAEFFGISAQWFRLERYYINTPSENLIKVSKFTFRRERPQFQIYGCAFSCRGTI